MTEPKFDLSFAAGEADIRAAQALRYRVFVEELGGGGEDVDYAAGLECDAFDPICRHLILRDLAREDDDQVVGVYRLMTEAGAAEAGRFYSEAEYDLAPLRRSGRKLLELGRSCLHQDYRGGAAMFHMWAGLAEFVTAEGAEILFGVASFHGTDLDALAAPLSILGHRHIAPTELRVAARPPEAVPLARLPEESYERIAAMKDVPALIKAYLRLGGCVGEGAWIDRKFNTTDVCMVMDTAQLNDRARAIYARPRP
ncbi:GNAT family N-acetyltransferase [Palleronia sp.]|uniref:GNAT family N-acetyltransferase n=1 Tax=Palleronia sp. TaxID=1940284 RepID=UPI0035C845AB